MAAPLVDFFAGLVRRQRRPLRDDVEVGGDLQQRVQHQGPRLCDGLFHRQHADEVIADAQVVALRFDIRVHHLIVEKLRMLRAARDAPVVVVEQPAKESELSLLVEYLDLHEVGELPDECLYSLFQPRQVLLDLRPQERFHAAAGELSLQFADGAGGIMEEPGEGRAHAGLRPRSFKEDAIEDLDLVEVVALRFKELASLVDGRSNNRIVVVGEGNLRPVLL